MVDLSSVAWEVEVAKDGNKTSFMVPVMAAVADVVLQARSEKGVTVNAVLADGQYIYLGHGFVVMVNERLVGATALELVTEGQVAYRCLIGAVVRDEVIDPTPAVVHGELTDDDHIAFAVRAEVERYLRQLGGAGVFRDDIDPDELVDDILNGDLDFEEEDDDDGFVSRSYEEMAEERPSSSVSGNAGGRGAGEGPSQPADEEVDRGSGDASTTPA